MKNIKVHNRQSILDVAIQNMGSVESCFEMALQNEFSLTEDLTAGKEILAAPSVNNITTSYIDEKIVPATGITNIEIKEQYSKGEGIEFWGIEYDFIVS